MAKTGNQIYKYAKPHPFITPVIEERQQVGDLGSIGGFLGSSLPSDIFQHDQLMYSGPILENIMFHISLEFEFREQGQQEWKAYKTSPNDFDKFVAGGSRNQDGAFRGATTLQNYPVKFFQFYIKDIQEKIEELVADGTYPDSLPSLMARIFLNSTTHTDTEFWTSKNRLANTLIVPVSESNNTQNINVEILTPIENIKNTWPFKHDSSHVKSVVPRMGIDFKGEAFVTRSDLGIRTSDLPEKSNFQGDPGRLQWPRSVVGQRRVEEDVTIEEGSIAESEGNTVEGIDSIHIPGIEADKIDQGRAIHFRQIAEEDAELPGAVGQPDPESGYSFFAHHPHVLHQLRYQPPFVERWDNTTEVKDYVENVFSNQTPNLPWYFSQEVEKVHLSDWGGWLIQGEGGLTGPGMFLRAYADEQYSNIATNCPFSVFFPPASSNCTCQATNTAYGIWSSSTETLIWNEKLVTNQLVNTGAAKQFGPKTRLILDASFNLGQGTGSNAGAAWWLGIRTSRIASVNLQPFVPIMGQTIGATSLSIFSSSKSVNLMDAMKFHYPDYEKGGIDVILAIGIFVQSTTAESEIVLAQDGPGGTFIPETDLGCEMGESTATCRKLYLFEPAWEGVGDPRTPPDFEHGTIQGPPDYNLPILG